MTIKIILAILFVLIVYFTGVHFGFKTGRETQEKEQEIILIKKYGLDYGQILSYLDHNKEIIGDIHRFHEQVHKEEENNQ
jgi:Na+/H+ antiporter NhaC